LPVAAMDMCASKSRVQESRLHACRREEMSEICSGGSDASAIHPEKRNAAARGAAEWLCLAAAPTFAVMALLTGVQSSGQPDIFCSAMHDASSLGGMVPMYVLMAAFHLAPWLKLVSSRRSGARRS
jgi:hypothetical protein